MYSLVVTREIERDNGRRVTVCRRYMSSSLDALIRQAGEYDTAEIRDVDGRVVYALAFPVLLKEQAC